MPGATVCRRRVGLLCYAPPMRLPLLLAALLAAAGPDDASVAHYNLEVSDVRDALFIDVTSGDFWTPPPSPALRSLDGAGRVAAARTFVAFAKAYTTSSDFQSRYAKWRTHELGEVPQKPPPYDQYVKEQNKLAKSAGATPPAIGPAGLPGQPTPAISPSSSSCSTTEPGSALGWTTTPAPRMPPAP